MAKIALDKTGMDEDSTKFLDSYNFSWWQGNGERLKKVLLDA